MGRRCVICPHPERKAIDKAIANTVSYRRIAAQYQLCDKTVVRHAQQCVQSKTVRFQARLTKKAALEIITPEIEAFRAFTSHARMLAEVNQQLFLDFQSAPTLEARAGIAKILFTGLDQAAKRDGAYIKATPDPQDIANLLRATYPNLTAAELRLAAQFAPGLDADAVVASFEQSM